MQTKMNSKLLGIDILGPLYYWNWSQTPLKIDKSVMDSSFTEIVCIVDMIEQENRYVAIATSPIITHMQGPQWNFFLS